MLAVVRLGHQHLDVAAEDLGGPVAEDLLGGRVERLDHPPLVDGDDAVNHVVQDRPQGFVGLLAVGQVAGDFRDASQLARAVEEGGDDGMGPVAGAVLADPPAFLFEPARSDGGLERESRLPVGDLRRRIEAGEVPAEDLVGLVAGDAFGPGVPAHDVAVRVEHEDGVVLHALDREAVPLLARLEIFRRVLGTGHGSLAIRSVSPSDRVSGAGSGNLAVSGDTPTIHAWDSSAVPTAPVSLV